MSETVLMTILAIIANELTPYRLHLHRRIVAELPEVTLWSVFTHEGPYAEPIDPAIRPVRFGAGERAADPITALTLMREWRKGGRIIRWLESAGVNQVILFGYNDPARLRVFRWCAVRGIACYVFGDSNVLGDFASGLKRWIKHTYLRWVTQSAAGILHCGRLGLKYFLRYGAPPDRLHPFPYEPDYSAVTAAGPREIDAAVDHFRLPRGRRRLLFAGRMVRAKRPDLLLKAFQSIAPERPEWDLVLAGEGPLRVALQASIPTALQPRIHFTGFVSSRELLSGLYAASEVFVLPSDYEPWGVVLAEAATRLALVASSVTGAAADLIEDGRNGRIFPAGSLSALTQALMDVTAEDHYPRMQAESPRILEAWRARTDPVCTLSRLLELDRARTAA